MKKYIHNGIAIEVPQWCNFVAVDYSEESKAPLFAYSAKPCYNDKSRKWEPLFGKKELLGFMRIGDIDPSLTLMCVNEWAVDSVDILNPTMRGFFGK